MMAVGLIAILVAVALPKYDDYRYRIEVAEAIGEIGSMSERIKQYHMDERAPPNSLADVGFAGKLDPWGTPYQYTDLTAPGGTGAARKDRKLNPLNSDFDLYSVGRDKESVGPLAPNVSQDDVLRANNGAFIGLGKDF
jgi:general secretion pathway protein G